MEVQGTPAGAQPPAAPPSSWPTPPPGPAAGLAYAGFGVRLVALIVDFLIIGFIGSLLAGVLGLGLIGFYGTDWTSADYFRLNLGGAWFAWVLVQAAVSGVYFVWTWRTWNATVGQRVFRLQVRNAADGAPMTLDQAIRRWAFLTVPVVGQLPVLGFLVFLYQLFLGYTTYSDAAKQGFHDKQCRTVVVRPVS